MKSRWFFFFVPIFAKYNKSYICNILYHAVDNSRLSITDTQEKILWTFLENRDITEVRDNLPKNIEKLENFDRFEPMMRGLTSYDLGKNNMPRRTWDINKEYLLGFQLVVLIREEKKGKQLRRYYDITPVGRFTLLQKMDIASLEKDFIKKFSVFVPAVAKHWTELQKIWGEKLYFILKSSLLQINWFQWHKDIKIVRQAREESKIQRLLSLVFEEFELLPSSKKAEYSEVIDMLRGNQDKRGDKLLAFVGKRLQNLRHDKTNRQETGMIMNMMMLSDELNKPNDRIENQAGTQMVEKTTIPFESQQIEITLFRKYTDFTKTKAKQSRKETVGNMISSKIVIPKSFNMIDFDNANNDIMHRLVFVFYYNLARYCKEKEAAFSLTEWVWEYTKRKNTSKKDLQKEFKKDPMNVINMINDEKYKIAKEIEKASKKTVTIIQKNTELQEIMNIEINEIKSKLILPKTTSELLTEINRQ